MKHLNRLLVVENEPKDAKRAAEAAKLAGFEEIEARTTPQAARAYLEDRLAEEGALRTLSFSISTLVSKADSNC